MTDDRKERQQRATELLDMVLDMARTEFNFVDITTSSRLLAKWLRDNVNPDLVADALAGFALRTARHASAREARETNAGAQPTTVSVDEPQRRRPPLREVRTVRACDLSDFQNTLALDFNDGPLVVRIDGRWREIIGTFEWDDDEEEVAGQFAAGDDFPEKISALLNQGPDNVWIVVQYLVEEKRDALGGLANELRRWRACDLVEVQVPVAWPWGVRS